MMLVRKKATRSGTSLNSVFQQGLGKSQLLNMILNLDEVLDRILINVQRGQVNETAQSLLEIDGVAEVYSVTGEYDLVALLRLHRYEDLAEVVTNHMVKLPSITKTNTLMAFQCYSRADLQQAWDIGVE